MRAFALPLLAALVLTGCVRETPTSALVPALHAASAPQPPDFATAVHWEAERAAPREIVLNDSFATGSSAQLLRYVHGTLPGEAWIESPQPWRLLQQNGGWLLVGNVVEHRPPASHAQMPSYLATMEVFATGTLPEGEYTVMIQCTLVDEGAGRTTPCQAPAEIEFEIEHGAVRHE